MRRLLRWLFVAPATDQARQAERIARQCEEGGEWLKAAHWWGSAARYYGEAAGWYRRRAFCWYAASGLLAAAGVGICWWWS